MFSSSLCRAHRSHLGPTSRRRRLTFPARGCQSMKTSDWTRNFIHSFHVRRMFIQSFNGSISLSSLHTRTLTITTCATLRQELIALQRVNDTSTPTLEEAATTFSSYSVAKPHLLLTPKDFLVELFQKNGVQNAGESFHVDSFVHKSKTWYTATFTDPVTNEIFPSGLERHTFLGKQLHGNRTKAMNGKVYCLDPIRAEHAAAARAIDCYIFREGSAGTYAVENQLCLESPYINITNAVISKSIDDDSNTYHRNKIQISRGATFSPQLLTTPCRLLHTIFALNNHDSTKNMKTHRRVHHDGETWFTATFTDPITNETFSSGLVITDVNVQETDTALSLHHARAMQVDGIVYYREASLAHQAAAARAIDCYVYRGETIVGSATTTDAIRLCIEDPAGDENTPIHYDAIIRRRNIQLKTSDEDVFEMESYEDEHQRIDTNTISVCYDESNDVKSSDCVLPALTMAMDDPIGEIKQFHNLSTMGRILEIWIAGFDTSSDDVYCESNMHSGNDSPSAKIKSILDWYERVLSNPRTKTELSVLVCGKLLASLGKANIEQFANADGSFVRVETEAKKILGRIISLSHSSHLDTDTLNAYLNCLDRCNPDQSAVYAEELLQDMRSQSEHKRIKGVSLPLPNVETYNAVMNLWALVGGSDGQYGVNRVYSLLEAAALEGEEFSSRPNSTTFETLIAVNSKKDDGQFSFEQAKLWLLKIKEASVSICGESFTPDVDIFTAALSAQTISLDVGDVDSRHSASWLRYGDPYVGGFKSKNEQSTGEATNVAQWLLYAEELGVSPNTEMYEAVIRAWTKTGTRDGLIIAEDWAKRAVSSCSPTRLETFHPIIAAWALCQVDRAPARVKEWIHQLSGLSATMPHLKPDLNIISAEIISWMNVQAGIIAKANQTKKSSLSSSSEGRLNGISLDSPLQTSDENKVPQDVEMVFVAAKNCMQCLQTVLSAQPERSQDIEALTSMVINTIQTWGYASQFALLHPATLSATLDTSYGVHEMLNVAKLVIGRTESDDNKNDDIFDDEERAYINFQLLGQSYAEIISQLHQIDSASEAPSMEVSSFSYFSREIAHVERILNEFDVQSKKISPQDNFSSESTELRIRLYKEILIGCARLTSPSDFGHVMRLCKLIMDQLLWQEANCCCVESGNNRNGHIHLPDITSLYADMALLMGTIVPVPQERTYVLTIIWQNAKQFFRPKSDRSTYATVNQARLIGAMRMAMGEWEATESFMRYFDEWRWLPARRRVRGNTWLAFVQDLIRQRMNITCVDASADQSSCRSHT